MIAANIIGASISSAIRYPTRGTINKTRKQPDTALAANTKAK